MICIKKVNSCSGLVGITASVLQCSHSGKGRGFLPKDRGTGEQSLYIWTEARHWGRIRSLSAISISLLLFACQHQHKESSLLDCAEGSADTEWREREGAVGARERERELLNAIRGDWKRSALKRSLMYGLIWACTVVRACSIGCKFTKLMIHIKPQRHFASCLCSTVGGSKESIFLHF